MPHIKPYFEACSFYLKKVNADLCEFTYTNIFSGLTLVFIYLEAVIVLILNKIPFENAICHQRPTKNKMLVFVYLIRARLLSFQKMNPCLTKLLKIEA